jgi:hypothetical protein
MELVAVERCTQYIENLKPLFSLVSHYSCVYSYALGITSRLSGLVSSFTETERELVAVERCTHYIENF